jgi:hypothetical protein
MKTLSQFKQAMKAPMYQKLNPKELILYKTGFKKWLSNVCPTSSTKNGLSIIKIKN